MPTEITSTMEELIGTIVVVVDEIGTHREYAANAITNVGSMLDNGVRPEKIQRFLQGVLGKINPIRVNALCEDFRKITIREQLKLTRKYNEFSESEKHVKWVAESTPRR